MSHIYEMKRDKWSKDALPKSILVLHGNSSFACNV